MSEKIMVSGVFCKSKQTKYGEIIKVSFELESFIAFARENCKKSEKNGKYYLNADCLSNSVGKRYMALDTFEPQQQQAQAPQAPAYQPPPQAPPMPPPMPDGNCDCAPTGDIPF
jgi:hypothetical protein